MTSAASLCRRLQGHPSSVALVLCVSIAGLSLPGSAFAILPATPNVAALELPTRPEPEAIARRAAPELESRAGGQWTLLWDPWTRAAAVGLRGLPGRSGPVIAPTQALAAAEGFLQRHATLVGARPGELTRVRCEHLGRAWYITWQQQTRDRDVLGCWLNLVLSESGEPIAFRSTLVPGIETPSNAFVAREPALRAAADRAGEALQVESTRPIVVALPRDAGYEAVAAHRYVLRGRTGTSWEALADDATGTLLAFESRLRTLRLQGQAHADVLPRYAGDALEAHGLQWLDVAFTNRSENHATTADVDGAFGFDVASPGTCEVQAGLIGRYVQLTNQAGDPPADAIATASVPGDVALHFGEAEARLDERTIYYHTNVIHEFVKARFDFTLLDVSMPAVAAVVNPVNGSHDYANAFWDGTGINFGNGGGVYENFGLFADVVYHEYTHGITDRMYEDGGGLRGNEGGAIHEALSDYFACTITNEPLLGENLQGPGSYLRNLDNTLRWPEDRQDEVHADGEIFGGALWDVRELLGADVADPIIHFSRTMFPQTFAEYATVMLTQDDILFGDGAPGNGSPNRDAIITAFAAHGMGPGVSTSRRLQHEPLRDTEEVGVPRTVIAEFDLGISTPFDSLRLSWSNGGPFQVVRMQRQPDGRFAGQIPPQPEGTEIHYWMGTLPRRGIPTQVLPPGAPGATYSYHVGPDTQPPTITHAPRVAAAAFSWPAQLVMDLEDNLGLAYAYVEYLHNGTPGPMLGLVRDPLVPNRFMTEFPNVAVQGDEIEYWIIARDASRSGLVTRLPETGGFQFRLEAVLEESFESGGPWSHRSIVLARPDPWHVSDGVDHTPGGERAWLCGDPTGEYPPSVAAELVTDLYSLGNGAHAAVWSLFDGETNGPFEAFDGGVVQIQVDGDPSWHELVPEGGYPYRMADTGGTNVLAPGTLCFSGHDADWRELRFDLNPWSNQRVRLRFLFGSDNVPSPGGALHGWALDDFSLDPGQRDPTDTAEIPASSATKLLASLPAPNPGQGRIAFALQVPPTAGHVRLDIFDAAGRRVRRLLDAALPVGVRQVHWDGQAEDGRPLPAGVYYYRLNSRLGLEQGRLVRLR